MGVACMRIHAILLVTSGRDQLARSMLNGERLSQLTWASEVDFVAHKQSSFEEMVHQSKDERHEYQIQVEKRPVTHDQCP